jgi:dTDP-4-amino-4,6-dideoxygalactose transaminase
MIPFLDLKAAYLEIQNELDAAYQRVMNSGWYILGEEVETFEREYAEYCGTKHCIGVGNGLEALHLILRGYGIGAGDEVIVPSNTYIATWLALLTPKPRPCRLNQTLILTISRPNASKRQSPNERKRLCPCIFTDSPPRWTR